MRKCFLFSIVVIILLLSGILSPVSAVEIPQLKSYVTDEVGVVVYSDYYVTIYGMCDILDQETSCEIAILVINSTEEMEIVDYAIEVFNSNGIGNKEKDNGVLIVVATGDQSYFIAVGRGLEYILNDAKVGRFARDYYVPYAELGDYGYAVYALTAMIAGEIVDNYEEASPHRYPIDGIPLDWPALIITFLVLVGIMVATKGRVFIWIGGYFRRFSGGKTGGGGAGGKHN